MGQGTYRQEGAKARRPPAAAYWLCLSATAPPDAGARRPQQPPNAASFITLHSTTRQRANSLFLRADKK